ncbi:MAG TPA: phospholipase D-like domain-containing protein [Blastocatellia bacterium]|nr:phospholipase D-like domain-containing protein [Blastocatellia bacterium]
MPVPTEIETEIKEEIPPPPEPLRRLRDEARCRTAGPVGLMTRLRCHVWSWWLWVLIQAAEMTWKRWLGLLALLIFAVIVYLFRPVEEEPQYGLDHEFAIDSAEFLPSIAGATDTPFLPGNRIDILNNGDGFYPAMLDAIERAERSITIEAYIYWAGEIGRRFAEALAAKARAGMPVKILLDAVGSATISDELLNTMKAGGCQVAWYHPVRWYTMDRANNRTHRKSLIVDGRVGFTGGAGIADQWLGNAENPARWRDIQIRIEGAAVTPLQSAFARNWLETTHEMISGPAFYPQTEPAGALAAQSILSSPESGSSTVRIMYYLSIACARKSIFIANPYFIPDEQAVGILTEARKRGVDVKVMTTGIHNDNLLARYNSTRLYGRLLEAGVEIYEFNRTMLHQKYMVCDGIWSTVGTTNFDARSFALNDENNVCVYDRNFAAEWERIFRDDLAACHRVTLENWRKRGLAMRLGELVAVLLQKQV